jgi:hypothetical protein
MANYRLMNVSGKPTAVNLDQVVYAEVVGSTVRLVAPGGYVVTIDVTEGTSVDDVWKYLFPGSDSPMPSVG